MSRDSKRQLSAIDRELLLKRVKGVDANVRRDRIERSHRNTGPLSFAQQRMWLMDQVTPVRWMNNIPSAVRIPGSLDVTSVERAINEVVRRHEALRTVFRLEHDEPVQIVMPEVRVALELVDLRAFPGDGRLAEAMRLADERAHLPFDLTEGPLLRASLLRLAADDHLFVLTVHHIAADGWSMGVFATELTTLYRSFAAGHPSPLPELPIQYLDYALWQQQRTNSVAFEGQLAYWKHKLASLPPLDLPTDRPRPGTRTNRGAHCHLLIPARIIDALSTLCRSEDATLFMGLLSIFYVVLHRHTGQDDIAVGSYVAGRNRVEVEPLIGFFLNTLVLRLDMSGKPSFRETLRRVRQMALEAYEHQDVPFEQLVDALQVERDPSRNPLCQVAFQLQNASAVTAGAPGAPPAMSFARDTAIFDLAANAFETTDGVSIEFEYSADMFDARTVERLATHFEMLLHSVTTGPDEHVGRLTILTADERNCLLERWNNTSRDRDWSVGLVELFERQVMRADHAEAFRCGTTTLPFGELNRRANQLARHLRARGVRDDVVVAVCLGRSNEAAIALLAVLKAGGIYLALDPTFPTERLAFMLADSAAVALISDREHAVLLPPTARPVLIDTELDAIGRQDSHNLGIARRSEDAAYIVYTSGSTGKPKGVAATHVQILNRLYWMWDAYPFGGNEVACNKTSLSFVDSLWELLGALLSGLPTVVLSDEIVRDPSMLIEALAANRVTRIWLVPSFLHTLLETTNALGSRLPDLKFWVSSGEPLSRSVLEQFNAAHPTATLFNLYGTSEAWDTTWHVPDRRSDCAPLVPIGRPIDNTWVRIIDRHGELAPIGVPGELCVGGLGVACGYLNQPALTAERFVSDVHAPAGGRLYRTGDLARWRSDGCLEYLGRIDSKIKIRGYRIEPGEVEAELQAHPAIARAVVVGRVGADGQPALAAYCTCRYATQVSRLSLTQFLLRKLPAPMVPASITFLDTFPLTPTGKVDTQALPLPAVGATDEPLDRDPKGAIEPALAQIWQELFGRQGIGVFRNFFSELGGDSLLAMRAVARVREQLKIELPVRSLFDAPTIVELAARIEQSSKAPVGPELVPAARERYRLSET